MKIGSRLAMILLLLVAIAHLLRLIFSIPVSAGDWIVPQYVSVIGVIVPAGIAWLLWGERSKY